MSTPTFTPGQRVRVVAPGRIFDGMTGVVSHRGGESYLVENLNGEADAWCLCLARELAPLEDEQSAGGEARKARDAKVAGAKVYLALDEQGMRLEFEEEKR